MFTTPSASVNTFSVSWYIHNCEKPQKADLNRSRLSYPFSYYLINFFLSVSPSRRQAGICSALIVSSQNVVQMVFICCTFQWVYSKFSLYNYVPWTAFDSCILVKNLLSLFAFLKACNYFRLVFPPSYIIKDIMK